MTVTCSEQLRAEPEPAAGTAPWARGWLLIECSGPWGRKALTSSALDATVGARLDERGRELGVKPVLIRRPGRPEDPGGPGRSVFLSHAGARPWAERVALHDDRDLLDLDLSVCLQGEPPGLGEAVTEPLFLVCTHAKRDRCCASFGRPIADSLAARHPVSTWEVSHVGGHRFAGNLLILPAGILHGGLDVAGALQAVAAHLAGRIELSTLRGRTQLPAPAQAAEIAMREMRGDTSLGGYVVAERLRRDDEAVVEVVSDTDRALVALRREPLGRRLLSCDAEDHEDPHTWRVSATLPA